MSTPQDQASTSPPVASSSSPAEGSAGAGTSKHQSAADIASGHLDDALAALQGAYDHPAHAERLKAIGAHVATLKGWIDAMPGHEESRADHAERVMDAYRNMKLPPVLPDHDRQMIQWELERSN